MTTERSYNRIETVETATKYTAELLLTHIILLYFTDDAIIA